MSKHIGLKGKVKRQLLGGRYDNVPTPFGTVKVNMEAVLNVQVWLDTEDNDPTSWDQSGRDDIQRELEQICERISAIYATGRSQATAAAQAEFDFSCSHGIGDAEGR